MENTGGERRWRAQVENTGGEHRWRTEVESAGGERTRQFVLAQLLRKRGMLEVGLLKAHLCHHPHVCWPRAMPACSGFWWVLGQRQVVENYGGI